MHTLALQVLTGTVYLLLSHTAQAIDRFELSWATTDTGSWRLLGAGLSIDWSAPQQPKLVAEADALEIGDHHFRQLRLVCPGFELLVTEVRCRNGALSMRSDWLSADAVPASLHYHFVTRRLEISATGLTFAGGRLRLAFTYADDDWRLDAGFSGLEFSALAGMLEGINSVAAKLAYQGRAEGRLGVHGNAGGLSGFDWQLKTENAGYANPAGNQAAEALSLASHGTALPRGSDDWKIQAELEANRGMLYSEPVYLEFSADRALHLALDLHWQPGAGTLAIESLAFTQPEVVQGRLNAHLQPSSDPPLSRMVLEIEQAWLAGLYTTWLQPWLAGTALGNLETAGRLHGRLELVNGQMQSAFLDLERVSFREGGGQFSIQDLDARMRWNSTGPAQLSTLGWQAASFYRMQLGAASVALETGADSLKMHKPLAVPLFDGELRVETFEIGMQDEQLHWLLDGMLTPVSMQALSNALDWPPLSGTLSGMFPKVRYRQGELTLGGVLLVQAFGGDITLHNLRIDQPLGLVPRLWVDARVEHLDLETLTEAFSFGRIEGQLQGRVDKLYMEAWQPVSFDARFRTPSDDNSRHRISQRAVDNISNLGGAGVAGALSRSFLRFLEDFPYKALGIGCRLENGVCQMDGVAAAGNGYYLVQGRTLPPRLDVIGYAREVDWVSLVERLKAVTAGAAPQIK